MGISDPRLALRPHADVGHEIAEKVGITIIVGATGKHFLLFTGAGRFRPEPDTLAR